MMNTFSIVGFWKFKSNRVLQDHGDWHTETLSGGSMAFSKTDAVLFVRSEQGPWGYSGNYQLNGEVMKIQIDASTAEDLAQTSIERHLKWMNENEFLFTGSESHTGRAFETHFVRA